MITSSVVMYALALLPIWSRSNSGSLLKIEVIKLTASMSLIDLHFNSSNNKLK